MDSEKEQNKKRNKEKLKCAAAEETTSKFMMVNVVNGEKHVNI